MVMIQVRNVSTETHRKLKERAAREGTTMSDLLRREADRLASQPSLDEVLARIKSREPFRHGTPASDLIREDRDSR